MFESTKPAPIDPALDDFRVSGREVVGLLKSLMDSSTLLHLSAPDGSHYATTLWTIDTGQRKLVVTHGPVNPSSSQSHNAWASISSTTPSP